MTVKLYLLPILRSVLFIFFGLFFAMITTQTLVELSRWWTLITILVNVITILVLVVICKNDGISYFDLLKNFKSKSNFKQTTLIILVMLVLGIGSMYGFSFLIFGYMPVTMLQPIPIWIAVFNLFILPFTIVLAEFPLYFGYVLDKIDEKTNNKKLAIVYPMVFYALQHSFVPLMFDAKHMVFRLLSFLPLLLVLGLIYYKTRNLKPLMIGHLILDFAVAAQILMTSLSPEIYEMMKSLSK